MTRVRWRTGTSVGRTIYIQAADTPSKQDQLIGLMDTPVMADLVVVAVNHWIATQGPQGTPYTVDEEAAWVASTMNTDPCANCDDTGA